MKVIIAIGLILLLGWVLSLNDPELHAPRINDPISVAGFSKSDEYEARRHVTASIARDHEREIEATIEAERQRAAEALWEQSQS